MASRNGINRETRPSRSLHLCVFARNPVRRTTANPQSPLRNPRSGFTLVELLVSITIIGILAAVVMGALQAARQVARVAKTKATIAKLNTIIMQRYESYHTRRVPISTTNLDPRVAARRRLDAIRDLMRMEMPERWSDVQETVETLPERKGTPFPYTWGSVPRPALSRRYLQYYQANTPDTTNQWAECLYMTVMLGGTSDERASFSENEIGDTDDDGCSEFLDGWGRPIWFLRWAPAFNDSGIQTNIDPWDDSPAMLTSMGNAAKNDHDPFDPQKVDMHDIRVNPPTLDDAPRGWRLVPLIYSSGPDHESDINVLADHVYMGSPYFVNPADSPVEYLQMGKPLGSGQHYDNIHNHRIEAR